MPNSKLAIVIPVHSGIKQLRRCLSALQSSQYQDFSIIVVDHSESDEISRFITRDYQNVTHLRGSPSIWWSGATNLGIKRALDDNSQSIMLLNHDCFVRPDTIDQLLDTSELSNTAIVAPVQSNLQTGKNITKTYSCLLFGFPTLILPSSWIRSNKKKTIVETELIIGGRGVIIPSNVFQRVGLLEDKLFPHYGADHDFYFRCKKSGVLLYINKESTVDIDNSSGSTASRPGCLTPTQFLQSLTDRKSHRNIHDLKPLYQLHYPVRYLYSVGLGLNILRYFVIYAWQRLTSFL